MWKEADCGGADAGRRRDEAVVVKKLVSAPQRREGVALLVKQGHSERRACRITRLSRSSFRYERRDGDSVELEERIQAWAKRRKRYGYRRIWVELRREGRQVNRKRVHRLWKRLGLSLRAKKHRKKIKTGKSLPVKATHPKQVWTYDFLQDACENGRGESFNGKLRDECLNMELFRNLGEAQMVIETWRRHYNEEQPHSSLGYLTPLEYKRRWEEQQTGALPPDPRSLSLWEPQEHVPGGNGKACLLDRDDRPMPRRFAGQALGSLSSVALSSCPATSSVP